MNLTLRPLPNARTDHDAIQQGYRRIRDRANALLSRFETAFRDCSTSELRELLSGLDSIARFEEKSDFHKRYERIKAALPPMPVGGADFQEALFRPDPITGFAPLDNPHLWEDVAVAEERFTHLHFSRDFLTQQTAKNTNFLESALLKLDARDVIAALNRQGVSLGSRELLDERKQPNALYQAIIAQPKGIGGLFTADNWIEKADEMAQVYNALPEEKKALANYHHLRLEIESAKRPGSIGR